MLVRKEAHLHGPACADAARALQRGTYPLGYLLGTYRCMPTLGVGYDAKGNQIKNACFYNALKRAGGEPGHGNKQPGGVFDAVRESIRTLAADPHSNDIPHCLAIARDFED